MIEICQGDWVDVLRTMPDESVHTVCTSPPYWGLRDYGTGTWEGGSVDCDHSKKCSSVPHGSTLASAPTNSNHEREGWRGGVCGKCGAIKVDRQLGLERTPDEYVAKMVEGFREVRRVLRKDGTLWLNLGDSYAGGGNNRGSLDTLSAKQSSNRGAHGDIATPVRDANNAGCKPKDLVGIPWLVAFALRADGWYLRQDIIWAKPNPMPESVTDRCTKSHEYLFLLSKSERYYYDADAIAEPLARPEELYRATPAKFGGADKWPEAKKQSRLHSGNEYKRKEPAAYRGSSFTNGKTAATKPTVGLAEREEIYTRNKRSVWNIGTSPFPEAHFATFPPKLVEPCILAGCPEGGTVLDPFAGAGTTGKVCKELDRNAILIELNPAYIEMIERRIAATKEPCREKQETLPLISKEIK